MIGSFWNLCRACPSMPVDKQLHSEYRSTYRWHEFTGNSRPEVVRRAPAPNPSQFVGATNEPPLPRRKKCPELAYKSHEFIIGSEYTDTRRDAGANRMARSEERGGTPSRRSKSEGPPVVPNGRAYPIATEVDGTTGKQAGESNNGIFKKTITKLSTEYRFQFVWPNVRRIKGGESMSGTTQAAAGDYPRKSISMGALRMQQRDTATHPTHHIQHMMSAGLPTVHKKRTTNQKEATLHELEPLVSDAEDKKPIEKQVTIVEKRIAARPFSQTIDQERLNHFITKKENFGFVEAKDEVDNKQSVQQPEQQLVVMNGTAPPHSKPNLDLWFKEVVELRKKAGEYKCRGWGIEIDPDLYKKQKDLWDQVSKRSSLSALSLASSVHRPITKEEKEQENNKKSIPLQKTTQKSRVPGQAHLIDNKDEISALPARFSNIRHHLERTTGPDVEEGALLPSPTREKLMPAITKRESESQRGSPKKTAVSRHGSPQKGSPQKGSPKKVLKTRSQSVGPGVVENESPKRQLRSASQTRGAAVGGGKKTPTSAIAPSATSSIGHGHSTERKPRPSTLSATFQSRIKSSSQPPPSGRTTTTSTKNAAANLHHSQSSNQGNNNNNNKKSLSTSSNKQQKQQQQQQKPQPQMRKKDKDRTNIGYTIGMGGGSNSGSGIGGGNIPSGRVDDKIINSSGSVGGDGGCGVVDSSSGGVCVDDSVVSANALKQQQNKQKQQQLKLQLQTKQQQPRTTSATTTTSSATTTSATTSAGAAAINKRLTVPGQDGDVKKLAENDGEDGRETAISISSCSPQPVPEVIDEPIVKSPPEPTRVKSPEQIIMRSPDPVNWTVPLDTGKTFTVTQNVKEGENYSRPQSEIKASTPVEKPPPPPQSAPPQLTEQAKMDAWKKDHPNISNNPTAAAIAASGYGKVLTVTAQPAGYATPTMPGVAVRYEGKALPGSTLRCLDDPTTSAACLEGTSSSSTSASTTNTAATARSTAAEVLERARDRFDRFWGGGNTSKEEQV